VKASKYIIEALLFHVFPSTHFLVKQHFLSALLNLELSVRTKILLALLVCSYPLAKSFWISRHGVATPGVYARDKPSVSLIDILILMSKKIKWI